MKWSVSQMATWSAAEFYPLHKAQGNPVAEATKGTTLSDGRFCHSIAQPEVCAVVVVRLKEHYAISFQPELQNSLGMKMIAPFNFSL